MKRTGSTQRVGGAMDECCGREAAYGSPLWLDSKLKCKYHANQDLWAFLKERESRLRNLGANFMQVGLFMAVVVLRNRAWIGFDNRAILATIVDDAANYYSHSR